MEIYRTKFPGATWSNVLIVTLQEKINYFQRKKICGDLDLPIVRCHYLLCNLLPCCCRHDWGGTVPQLSFDLYQLNRRT